MSFLVIPAVDLKDGKCVQLVGGDPSKLLFSSDNPVEIAKMWEKEGARMIHVVDLDGALSGVRKNEKLVFEILENVGIPLEYGGGVRTVDDAVLFLEAGVYRVVLGTSAILNPEIISQLIYSYPSDRIMVAIEVKDETIMVKGWREGVDKSLERILSECEERGAGSILFTSVGVEGRLSGVDLKALEKILSLTTLPVFYSGGVTRLKDIKLIKDAGASGVIVGSALYKGKFSLREALEVVK
jgi:phosphoribosylformimino-5-aminoimidazole carboxamide ribotide isomerase